MQPACLDVFGHTCAFLRCCFRGLESGRHERLPDAIRVNMGLVSSEKAKHKFLSESCFGDFSFVSKMTTAKDTGKYFSFLSKRASGAFLCFGHPTYTTTHCAEECFGLRTPHGFAIGEDIEHAARYVCKMDWALLHERWQLSEQALQSLCFSAAYVVATWNSVFRGNEEDLANYVFLSVLTRFRCRESGRYHKRFGGTTWATNPPWYFLSALQAFYQACSKILKASTSSFLGLLEAGSTYKLRIQK